MSQTLFLSPHNDDETLFASYILQRYKPAVVVCLWGTTQGASIGSRRSAETEAALRVLGCNDFRQWRFSDTNPDWQAIEQNLCALDDVERVFAPYFIQGGHDHHNELSRIAGRVFGNCVSWYGTYRRGEGRFRDGLLESTPDDPSWVSRKFRAMACYTTQIEIANTRPWFSDWDREWWLP